jgi:two-component sensor histidine kinase
LFDSAGEMTGAVNVLVDIGHRKEAETRQHLLFAELNHRIKNNMQMLYALLAAARRETASEDARGALEEAGQRVAAMAAAQTALYQSDNLSRFDSAAFMTSVCAAAAAACGDKVSLNLHTAAGKLANDVAVPLALILNELVANAVKYGVDAGRHGTIQVALDEADGRFTLVVEDDGSRLRPVRGPPQVVGPGPGDGAGSADRRPLPGRARSGRALRGRVFRPARRGRLAGGCSRVARRVPVPC